MATEYFPRKAARSRCLSVEAAYRIRQFAIKKNGDRRDESDSNLLPIPAKTKEAFSSPESILQLLRCPCRELCGPFLSLQSQKEDEDLARETWKRKRRLQTFTVLVLSGCLFAYRVFHQHAHAFETLEAFINAVRNEHETHLQKLLFDSITAEDNQTLANRFFESVTGKLSLIRIPAFVTGGQPQHFRDQRWNYPFLNSELVAPSRAGHEFRRFSIHEDYFNSTELRNRRVFCKTIAFHPEDAVLRDDANREAEILSWMNSLRHPNIAELLFLFTETSDTLHRFNLVFRYHRHTLADVFGDAPNRDLMARFRPSQTAPGAHLTVLDHGLWKAMLGVLDAVKAIHEFSSRNGPYEYEEMVEGGHFDIKPANILISDDAGMPRLLLTDFGQSHLQRRYLNAAARRSMGMATLEYAPPECGLGAFSQSRIRASYDIWSLGCVLLEVLVFVTNDLDGHVEPNACVHQFHRDRLDSNRSEPIVSSAFWRAGQLQPVVARRLQALRDRRDDRLSEVLLQVESMLSVNVRDRPNISTCLRVLNSDRDLFMHAAHDDLSRRLKDMAVSFQTHKMLSPTPCNLFLWRECIDKEMDLTLILEFASSQRWADSRTLSSDFIIVESYYGSRLHYNPQQTPRIAVRFRRLHRGTTFHFDSVKEFFIFFHLMTHQQPAFGRPPERPASPVPRWGFRFNSIALRGDASHGRGMLQIWSTDTPKRHSEIFVRSHNRLGLTPQRSPGHDGASLGGSGVGVGVGRRVSSLSGDGPGGRGNSADARRSRFKLAVFVAREAPGGVVNGEVPGCYVVELDLNDIINDPVKDPQAFAFRAKDKLLGSFPVWAPALKDRSYDGGIPLDPEVLSAAIRTSAASVRLKRLEIAFVNAEECSAFKAAMAFYGL